MMNLETLDFAQAGRLELQQVVGDESLEILIDRPDVPLRGLAVLAHPQPLLGGSARHRVPHYLAKALVDSGWACIRPNFRGVGKSSGQHDEGWGETEDLLAICRSLQVSHPDLPLLLFGFSFGAFVQSQVAWRLQDMGQPPARVVLAGLPVGEVPAGRTYATPALLSCTLLIQGELDQDAPLQALLDHAGQQKLAVVVLPGADHAFSNHLPQLIQWVLSSLPDHP